MIPLEPGCMLGPVKLEQTLRKRTSSTLYAGHHHRLRMPVAVAVTLGAPPEDQERFLREARIASELAHPALPRTVDFGEYHGLRYLVTQLVQGKTLEQHLEETREPISERAMLKLIARVADALRICHAAGLAHRDLSPAALLVDRQGRLRVTDFGLAPGRGQLAATPDGSIPPLSPYLPPSSARPARDLDSRVDLFALGIIAYQLAFQRLPYKEWSQDEALTDIPGVEPAFDLPTHCSLRILHLIHKLIEPDPGARIRSALELLHMLPEEALETQPAPVGPEEKPPEAVHPPPRRLRRRLRWPNRS